MLSEEKMDALVNDCLKITEGKKHPFAKDSHVWSDMEAVVNLVLLRAQADAQPFSDDEHTLMSAVEHLRDVDRKPDASFRIASKLDEMRKRLAAHPAPEAAQALSDGEIESEWRMSTGMLWPRSVTNVTADDLLKFAKGIRNRGAATVAEPSKFVATTPEEVSDMLDRITQRAEPVADDAARLDALDKNGVSLCCAWKNTGFCGPDGMQWEAFVYGSNPMLKAHGKNVRAAIDAFIAAAPTPAAQGGVMKMDESLPAGCEKLDIRINKSGEVKVFPAGHPDDENWCAAVLTTDGWKAKQNAVDASKNDS